MAWCVYDYRSAHYGIIIILTTAIMPCVPRSLVMSFHLYGGVRKRPPPGFRGSSDYPDPNSNGITKLFHIQRSALPGKPPRLNRCHFVGDVGDVIGCVVWSTMIGGDWADFRCNSGDCKRVRMYPLRLLGWLGPMQHPPPPCVHTRLIQGTQPIKHSSLFLSLS